MKKKNVIILAVILLIGITITTIYFKLNSNSNPNKKIVGVYHNDNWNNREETLLLNEDGTCKYPSIYNKCEWKIEGSNVIMTLYTEKIYIDVYLEDHITTPYEIDNFENQLNSIGKITSVMYDEKEHKFRIKVAYVRYVDEVEKQINGFDGVWKTSEIEIPKSNHEATIVDGGLILHDHYFKKMN